MSTTISISKEMADWLFVRKSQMGRGHNYDDALRSILKELKELQQLVSS